MARSFLPFEFHPSRAAAQLIGRDLAAVAIEALRAVLRHRRSLEVAHQQIVWRSHHLAFSSRINDRGDLVIDLDVGDPRLADRLVTADELRSAERAAADLRGIARDGDRARRGQTSLSPRRR